ncbi:flagellar basal-body MS-ring/collar protein FliF [Rhodovulum imhoffii]|nr:flagellar basal-body MS-ring/collar protein FliF [Rhodovulum imhoffii]MBK5934068.1 flagellar M-ring protein FliF [Rhodovulum imhoffii]
MALWSELDVRKRMIVAAATAGVFVAVLMLSRLVATPGMALLYSGLDESAAGGVVRALEQQGVAHEIRGNAIFVDSAQRDTLRMTLATEGLPANGAAGYELLDTLTGFGTTSQMFDAAYWRAKEGELARTIVASPRIRAARVHIARPMGGAFRRDASPSAAVTVTAAAGAIGPDQAQALRYLVASSVAGMSPADVSVIDAASGIVLHEETGPGAAMFGTDRAAELRQNVERLLIARLGPGRSVVEVSVETVTESESIRERLVDPESRVAISTESEERASKSENGAAGAVTVASNLPDGDAQGGGNSARTDSETRERANYEISETEREVLRQPGAIRRLTVAVLIDGQQTVAADGTSGWTPLPDTEIEALHDLVASAVGYDEARGDVITLRSLPLQSAPATGTGPGSPGTLDKLLSHPMALIQMAALALVALILGLFVLRPILTRQLQALPVPPGLDGEVEMASAFDFPVSAMSENGNGGQLALPTEDAVARLREMIESRQVETVEILRNWMEEPEEQA